MFYRSSLVGCSSFLQTFSHDDAFLGFNVRLCCSFGFLLGLLDVSIWLYEPLVRGGKDFTWIAAFLLSSRSFPVLFRFLDCNGGAVLLSRADMLVEVVKWGYVNTL